MAICANLALFSLALYYTEMGRELGRSHHMHGDVLSLVLDNWMIAHVRQPDGIPLSMSPWKDSYERDRVYYNMNAVQLLRKSSDQLANLLAWP